MGGQPHGPRARRHRGGGVRPAARLRALERRLRRRLRQGRASDGGAAAPPLRHGRRGTRRLHRRGAPQGVRARRAGRAGGRRAVLGRRTAPARRASDLGLAADRAYGTWQEMLEGELARPEDERIDFVDDRDPERRALPGREGGRRGGVRRRLRQAARAHERAGRASSSQLVAQHGQRVRRDLQLHGLPARPGGARHGRGRRARRAAQGRRPVQPGLARDAARGDGQQAGGLAHRPRALRRRGSDGRHRLARREPGGDDHRPAHHARLRRPRDGRARAGCSTTTRSVLLRFDGGVRGVLDGVADRDRQRERPPHPRARRATARSPGGRRSRTCSCTARRTARARVLRRGNDYLSESAQKATRIPPGIRRATSRRSPTST